MKGKWQCFVIASFVPKGNLSQNLYTLVSYKKTMTFPDDNDFNQRKVRMFGNSLLCTERKPLTQPLHTC